MNTSARTCRYLALAAVCLPLIASQSALARQPATSVAVVTDRSSSIERGDGAACSAVRSLVAQAIAAQGTFRDLHLVAKASAFKLYGTAGNADPGLPEQLTDTLIFDVPQTSGYAARNVREQQLAEAKGAISTSIEAACRHGAKLQRTSPIYGAIKTATHWLEDRFTEPKDDGLLIVQSDLVENYEKPIGAAIRLLTGPKPPDTLPGNIRSTYGIDLQNRIRVHVCGVGEGSDVRQEAARDRVQSFWKENIFLNAKGDIIFEPVCDGYRPSTR